MNLKQASLTAAVTAALIASSPVVTAAVPEVFIGGKLTAHGKENTPVKFAIEQPTESSGKFLSIGKDLFINIPAIPGYIVNATNPLFFNISLKGGAKFAQVPKLLCKVTAGGGKFTAANPVGTVAADTTNVVFSMQTAYKIAAGTSGVCKLITTQSTGTNTAFYKVGNKTAQIVSAVLEYKNGLVDTKVSHVGTYITFAQTLATEIKSAGTAKIDVKEASKKFINATNVTQAQVGTLTFSKSISPAINSDGTTLPHLRRAVTAAMIPVADMLKTATVTVAGPVDGFASISLHDATDCGGSTLASSAPSSGKVTLNISGSTNLNKLSNTVYVCANVSGTTELVAGQLSLALSGTPQTNWNPVFIGEQFIRELRKNGASFRVLNVPNPTNPDQAFIRLYNPNPSATIVRGTMYGQDGVQIGTTRILDASNSAVPAFQVKILRASDLATLFGVETWNGRARLVIDAEAEKFNVQALMRGPSQILVNMSSETASSQ